MSISILNEVKDGTKLKIHTKKLSSGKCQVKFYVNSNKCSETYGYLLADSDQSLKNVMFSIMNQLKHVENMDNYYHNHLYALGRKNHLQDNFMLFRN